MEADGLDEVLMTDRGQQSTVHHTEVKEQGLLTVGFPACGESAAGVVLPRLALQVEGEATGMRKRLQLSVMDRRVSGQEGGHLELLWRGGTPVSVE